MIGILHNLKLSGKISTLKQIFSRTNLKSGIRNNVLVYIIRFPLIYECVERHHEDHLHSKDGL